MGITISIDQRFKTYTGTMDAIEAAIQADLNRTDNWFIKTMGVVQSGASIVLWALWEKQIRPV